MGACSANRAEDNPKNKPRKWTKCHDQENNKPQNIQYMTVIFGKTSQ